jgi:lipid II:glycine glycyltransferase (peptidoglycan interpeptide bridge formation enzyme)
MNNGIAKEFELVVCNEPEQAQSWDRFLSQCPEAHIEQTNDWAALKQIYGWKPVWFWIIRNGKILGGAMIQTRRLKRFATIGYIERGPVWDPGEHDAMGLVIKALSQVVRSMHLAYLVIVPPYAGEQLIPLLESLQFRHKPETIPPIGVGRATLLVDLRKDESALLADMSMTKRQNLRRAERKGVRVRTGDGADADTIRELMWTACRRRGVLPYPAQRDYFENLWRLMGPAGKVKFFIAEIDGQPVSAATAMVYGGTMQLFRVGWSGTHDKSNPNDLLHWEMIKWAKENGCRFFDFMHIRPDHARAILRGEHVKDSYSGVTEFKTSFGGEVQLLPDPYYRSFHPLVHFALRMGAARMIESGMFRSMLDSALASS